MNITIIGNSGGIGQAMQQQLEAAGHIVTGFSRSSALPIDFNKPETIEKAAASLSDTQDWIILTTGLLHNNVVSPEKSLRDIDNETMQQVFQVNTIGPALCAKHFIPKLKTDQKAIFAAISARVGSISDNRLGGWYAYRASKAALNMVLKNTAIEVARKYKQMIIMGLHPGTVDTGLSKPFQSYVKEGHLFTPEQSAKYLIEVLNKAETSYSGKVFDWDNKEVPA